MQQIDDFQADLQLHHPVAAGLGASHQPEPEAADHEPWPARPAVRSSPVNGERHEFDDLFDTVKGSLWGLLDQPAAGQPPWSPESTGSLSTRALQGAVALAQLHKKLTHEFQLREQLQREIVQAREELKRARAELAGTQAEARQVRHLAMHDELTELPNRSYFRRRLEQALSVDVACRQPLAVLFVDLDRFKQVNDSLGHSAGDELLRIVGARMARTVRAEDTVSRLGGDEFACILVGLGGRDQAAQLAAKIRDAIQAPCRIGDQLVRVGASIGIAIYPADGTDVDQLLINADLAMYRAKSQSGGYAFRDGPITVSLDIEI